MPRPQPQSQVPPELAELMALAQIMGTMQGPADSAQRSQDSRLHLALQALNVQQQQQQQAAQMALQEQELQQRATQHAGTLDYQNRSLTAQEAADKRRADTDVMQMVFGDPTTPNEMRWETGKRASPDVYAPAFTSATGQILDKQAAAKRPEVEALRNDPTRLAKYMTTIPPELQERLQLGPEAATAGQAVAGRPELAPYTSEDDFVNWLQTVVPPHTLGPGWGKIKGPAPEDNSINNPFRGGSLRLRR